jgi:hypothetical protein
LSLQPGLEFILARQKIAGLGKGDGHSRKET